MKSDKQSLVNIKIRKDNYAYITTNDCKLFNLILKSFTRNIKIYNRFLRKYTIKTTNFYSLVDSGSVIKVNAGLIDFLLESFNKRGVNYSLQNERQIAEFEDSDIIDYFNNGMKLFDYQKDAVKSIVKKPYTCIQVPTGAGKTLISASIIKTYKQKYKNKGILYVVPTLKLMKEATDRFNQYGISVKNTGVPFDCDSVNIITYTSLCVKDIDKADYNSISCIIFDECHRIKGDKSNKVIHKFNNLNMCVGVSATVSKNIETKQKLIDLDEDDIKIMGIFGKPAYYMPIIDAINDDFIAKLKVHFCNLNIKYAEEVRNETFWPDIKENVIYNKDRIDKIGSIMYETIKKNNYKTVCIYTPEKRMSQDYMLSFYNKLTDEEKQNYLVLMTYGSSKYETIINDKVYSVDDDLSKIEYNNAILDPNKTTIFSATTYFKEGIDIPNLEALFIIVGGKSETQIKQILGRIMRTFNKKEYAHAYEFVDNQVVLKSQINKRLNIYNRDYKASFVKD